MSAPRGGSMGNGKRAAKIEFEDVKLAFDERVVLNGVSFHVEPGEMKVVLGSSGSGKSTILRLAIGLIKPDEGRILIDGRDITNLDETALNEIRCRIGMVFQSSALFNSLTVYENVAFRLDELGWEEEMIDASVNRVLKFVDLLDSAWQLPDELSGGMKRRVAIARALVDNPEIIFYDEPTAGLDPPTARTICDMAVKLRDIENTTSIFVTHKLDDINYLSTHYYEGGNLLRTGNRLSLTNTKFIMLNEGRISFDGSADQLTGSQDPQIRRFLYGEQAA